MIQNYVEYKCLNCHIPRASKIPVELPDSPLSRLIIKSASYIGRAVS